MIPEKYIENIKKELKQLEEVRDNIIQLSIKITRLSKSVIYSLLRGDVKSAEKFRKEMLENVETAKNLIKEYPMFYNDLFVGMQEFVEAELFYYYLKSKDLPTHKDLDVDLMPYLFGLADFLGELNRKATNDIVKNKLESAKEIKEKMEDIYLKLLSLEPKYYELRRRIDRISGIIDSLNEKLFRAFTR